MTNIAFRDIAGGKIHVYTANQNLPKNERIKVALEELRSMGNIVIYLYKRRKFRIIKVKRY
jgi:hypothetical protein